MNGPGPASLADFAMEAQFWKRLGLRASDLDEMPWKQVVEYSTYIELICKKEAMDQQGPPGKPQPRM